MRTEGMPLRVAARLVERQERGVEFKFMSLPDRKLQQIQNLQSELAAETGTP